VPSAATRSSVRALRGFVAPTEQGTAYAIRIGKYLLKLRDYSQPDRVIYVRENSGFESWHELCRKSKN